MTGVEECKSCGVALTTENIEKVVWMKPYCPACWPSECPSCGGQHYIWSLVDEELQCDNGCHNHGEIKI